MLDTDTFTMRLRQAQCMDHIPRVTTVIDIMAHLRDEQPARAQEFTDIITHLEAARDELYAYYRRRPEQT